MPRPLDLILGMAAQRPLSAAEIARLTHYLNDLESRQAPEEDVLVRRIKELERKLEDCRAIIHKYDLNSIMD